MKLRRILSIMLSLVMLFSMVPMASAAGEIVASGSCGESLAWTLDSEGILTVSGEGSMNYEGAVPWADYRDSVIELIIEPGVTDIHEYAFWYCENLKSANLPEGLVSIGEYAFERCDALKSVTIPATVEFIGYRTFGTCDELEEIYFTGNAPSPNIHIFGCTATAYYPAENATWNGKANFATYGGNITWVDSGAEVPDEIVYSGSCGDGVNWKLSTLGTLTVYGDGAMDTYDIGAIEGVYPPWYKNRAMIERLVIESGVKAIGEEAFYDCRNLVEVILAEGLESVGHGAFWYCTNLSSISFPESLNYIDEAVFWDCKALKSVTFTSDELTIDGTMFDKNFVLEELNFTGNAPKFDTIAFHLVTATVYYPAENATWNGKTTDYSGTLTWVDNGIVPDEEVLASGSCGGNITWQLTNLGKLTISGEGRMPEGSYFPQFWDEWEYAVENVVIEEGLVNIIEGLFSNCKYMESISMPETLRDIGWVAFSGCSSLESVTIPAGVNYIDLSVFKDCDALENVIFKGSAPYFDAGAFRDITTTVTYPAEYCSWISVKDKNYGGSLTWLAEGDGDYVHDYTLKVTHPTCERGGYTTYTCNDCEFSYVDKYTDALGHKWSKGELTKEPTVKEEGEKTYTCGDCGEKMIEKIDALPDCKGKHKWDSGEVTKKPTNKAEGEKTFICTVCGEKKIEKIAKLVDVSVFKDVIAGNYFYESVKWALENEITAGVSKDSFGPSQVCTRAHVVTFLWRAAGEPSARSTENPFTDVKKGQYYYDAVLWAVEQGITGGLSETSFGPNVACSRAQVVTFLWRAAGKPQPQSGDNPFADVAGEQYYRDAVLWAVENGITTGLSESAFGPAESCTRAQVVTFLYRAFK